MPDEALYDVNQIAQILGVSKLSIRRYIKNGSLDAVLVGRAYRVKPSALDAFIEGRSGVRKSAPHHGGFKRGADNPNYQNKARVPMKFSVKRNYEKEN